MMQTSHALQDKIAIVTGGARGIGLAIVEEFVRAGAHVLVVDTGVSMTGESPAPDEVRAALSPFGERVTWLCEDIAAASTATQAVQTCVQRFGGLDIVVNNAAILRDSFIFKSERTHWEQVIATNLSGAWGMLSAATPVMREAVKAGRAPGRIVNIISTAGLYGNFAQAAYASSKAGLVALTRVTAMDMARAQVMCNALAPFASTRVTQSIQPANEAQKEYKARALRIPTGYVAKLVHWLASPACQITGQIFGVRAREVFLFSQPRPAAHLVTPPLEDFSFDQLEGEISRHFADRWVDLSTDLEAFNNEPLL